MYNLITHTIIVNKGNPNIQQLIDDIKTKILSAVPALVGLFTIVYNAYDNTITFSNQSANTIDFLFINNFVGKMLGFTTNAQCLPLSTLTSQITINVNPLQNVYVRSDNLTFSNSYESVVDKNDISDIIAIVPIYSTSGNFIVFNDSSNFETRLGDDSIDFISLYLTSAVDNDHLIDLFLDWTIHLQINEYALPTNNINLTPIETFRSSIAEPSQSQEEDFLIRRKRELDKQLNELKQKKQLKERF